MTLLYALGGVFLVSLVSVLAAIPLLMQKEVSNKILLVLLSFSVGALLSTVFMDFLPEAVSHGYTLGLAINVLLGFLMLFCVEKFVHFHHLTCDTKSAHHRKRLGPLILVGDGLHNFVDGLVIAGSFAANIGLGITATISILLHELPQEIGDMGVLLYSGYSKWKALAFNFASAATAIIGTLIGWYLSGNLAGFNEFIIPFAAGNFLYIACASLVPELHRECGWKDTLVHLFAILLGIVLITLITLYGPAHGH